MVFGDGADDRRLIRLVTLEAQELQNKVNGGKI